MTHCTCGEWEKGIKEIINAQAFYAYHDGTVYESRPFEFCPWCGKKLKKDGTEEEADQKENADERPGWYEHDPITDTHHFTQGTFSFRLPNINSTSFHIPSIGSTKYKI